MLLRLKFYLENHFLQSSYELNYHKFWITLTYALYNRSMSINMSSLMRLHASLKLALQIVYKMVAYNHISSGMDGVY